MTNNTRERTAKDFMQETNITRSEIAELVFDFFVFMAFSTMVFAVIVVFTASFSVFATSIAHFPIDAQYLFIILFFIIGVAVICAAFFKIIDLFYGEKDLCER